MFLKEIAPWLDTGLRCIWWRVHATARVTAATSAGLYLSHGYILLGFTMPVMPGVLVGSFAGSHVLVNAQVGTLRLVFGVVIVALSAEMIYSGVTGRL